MYMWRCAEREPRLVKVSSGKPHMPTEIFLHSHIDTGSQTQPCHKTGNNSQYLRNDCYILSVLHILI